MTGWDSGFNFDIGQGVILHTTDGGSNWLPQTTESTDILNSAYLIDANRGWAI